MLDLNLSATAKPKQCTPDLPQNRTEALIRDALAGLCVTTQYSTDSTRVENSGDHATVGFADGRVETYHWIIGYDGRCSTTREQLEIAYDGYDLPQECSIADIDRSKDFDCERTRFYIQGKNGNTTTCLQAQTFKYLIL